jgi:hypothetical protein
MKGYRQTKNVNVALTGNRCRAIHCLRLIHAEAFASRQTTTGPTLKL